MFMKPHDKIAHMKTVDNLLTRKRGREAEANSLIHTGPSDTHGGSKQSRANLAFAFLWTQEAIRVKYVIWFRGKL